VYSIVGGLLFLFLTAAAVTTVARLHATDVGNHVRDMLRPAQSSSAKLTQAYLDMETGARGYLLTKDRQFLQPYDSGQAGVTVQSRRLHELMAFDQPSVALIDAVTMAGATWLNDSVVPSLAAARDGTFTGDRVMVNSVTGKQDFDVLRSRLDVLQGRIDALTGDGLQVGISAQNVANTVTIVCAAIALLLGVLAVLLVRGSLDRPLRRLSEQVQRVSDGELESRVDASGPAEVAGLGQAVETMRVRILSEITRATEASQQLVRLEETDRIARELGNTVIKRLFTIGLAMQSAAGRFPAVRPVFTRAIEDLDQAINQLRSALYGHTPTPSGQSLGLAVQELVSEVEAGLGVVPELLLTGDLDRELPDAVVVEILGVLHDALRAVITPGVGGPVEIELARTDGTIRLRIAGHAPQAKPDQDILAGLPERARLYRGDATIGYDDARVVIDWWVPM
jgi:CHASE3 domain sensor protein